MNYKHSQSSKKAAIHNVLGAVLMIAVAFSTLGTAAAQRVTPPPTPIDITPLAGNTAFLVGHAIGSQGYTCLPTSAGGTAWNPTARPEATLFANFFGQPVQIITHFASIDANPNGFAPKPVPLGGNATWQSSFDSSKVWAVATGHIDAGTDASCPNRGSIQCLLLQSIGNQEDQPVASSLLKQLSSSA